MLCSDNEYKKDASQIRSVGVALALLLVVVVFWELIRKEASKIRSVGVAAAFLFFLVIVYLFCIYYVSTIYCVSSLFI